MTTPCPSDDQLAALASGTLDAAAVAELERHLDACSTCRQLVAVVSNGSAPTHKHTFAVLRPGERLGRYEIERLIGAGGMGVLYVARDPQLGRRVALKLMRPAFGAEGGRVRLLREAQAMATLSHPNVVSVFDIGEADERVFVAMELLESGTLREWMKQPHSWKELVEMFCAAGDGLAAAHAAGVVHRDFKPENVLIGKDGRPRVGDFGLARPELVAEEEPPRSAQALMRVTQTGTMLGTPAYMSPEQLKGKPADHRSDQYGFCVSLYEALAGKRPFPADTLEELRARVEGGMPPPPREGLVPAHVWAAIARGLNPNPAERFPDLPSLLRVLRAELPEPARARRELRLPRAAACGGLMAIAIGAGVALRGGGAPQADASALPIAAAPTPPQPAPHPPEPAAPPEPVETTEFYSLSVGAKKVITIPSVQYFVVDDAELVSTKLLGNDQVLLEAHGAGNTGFSVTLTTGAVLRGELEVELPEPTYTGAPNLLADRVSLAVSQSKVFDVPKLTRVAIGDPEVCDVRTLGSSQVMLLGAAEGTTTLLVWDADGKRTSTTVKVSRASAAPVLKRVAGAPFDTVTPMVVGQQLVFDVKDLTTVAIGDPALADVKMLDGAQVLAIGSAAGTTTLWVWTLDGKRYSTELAIDEASPQEVLLTAGEDAFVPFSHVERTRGGAPALLGLAREGNSLRLTGKKAGKVALQVFTGVGAPITVNVTIAPASRELDRERLTLGTKDLVQFHLAGLERVAIGDPAVADVKVLDEDRLEVHGLSPGKTLLLAWMRDGSRRSWEIEIR